MKQWRSVIIYDKINDQYVDLGERYLVNQYGEIYSKYSRKLLKHNIIKKGYHMVRMSFNGSQYDKLVHNVVGWTFPDICGKYEPGLQINHKDENKHNNCVDNLEWISRQNNLYYGTRLDRIKSSKDNKLNDRGRNSCEKKLMSVVVKCKDIGMNREKVEDMINKVVDGVFGEE